MSVNSGRGAIVIVVVESSAVVMVGRATLGLGMGVVGRYFGAWLRMLCCMWYVVCGMRCDAMPMCQRGLRGLGVGNVVSWLRSNARATRTKKKLPDATGCQVAG